MPSVPQRRVRVPHFRPRDKILTLREAAKILGVSRHTAYIWAATGRIPARQLGPMFFVREKDIRKSAEESGRVVSNKLPMQQRNRELLASRRKPAQ